MSKNIRKNKTNLVVKWPTTHYFTIKDLFALNPDFIEITLRVRLSKAIEKEKSIVEIGSIPSPKGRPLKIFAKTPVSKLTLDKAEAEGVLLVDRAREILINVVSLQTQPEPSSTDPVTTDKLANATA